MPEIKAISTRSILFGTLCAVAAFGTGGGRASAHPVAVATVPLTSGEWTPLPSPSWVGSVSPQLAFDRPEGFPRGRLTLNEGVAIASHAAFRSGTIDLDIKPLGYSDAGLIFRRSGDGDGEMVYLRGNPDCPAADDCIQYAPIVHGHMQWDIYPNYQRPAPIAPAGWNHLRIEVSAATMRVFVNDQARPTLIVPRLQGLSGAGGLALKGPAIYANLEIRAQTRTVAAPRERSETGAIRTWRVALAATASPSPVADYTDVPQRGWLPAVVEPNGLVNLNRSFGSASTADLSTAWLETTLVAPRRERRMLALGFARRVALFLNGKRIYAGDNPYYPAEQRLTPDGRLDRDDASVELDLRPGRNELTAAVSDTWTTSKGVAKPSPYGWGLQAYLSDDHGTAARQPRQVAGVPPRLAMASGGTGR